MQLEILSNGKWLEVSEFVFRSWTGSRRLNGSLYHGVETVAVPFIDSPSIVPKKQ